MIVILVVFFTRQQESQICGLVSTSVEGDEPTIPETNSRTKIVDPALDSGKCSGVLIKEAAAVYDTRDCQHWNGFVIAASIFDNLGYGFAPLIQMTLGTVTGVLDTGRVEKTISSEP